MSGNPSSRYWTKPLGTSGCFRALGERWEDPWIGLRENLQESPIFNGKIYGFLYIDFPLNQSIEKMGGHVGNPRLGYLQSQEPTMTCGPLGCTSCNNPRVLFQGMSVSHKPGWFMIGFTAWQEIKMLMQQKMVSFTNLQFMENG